MKKKTSVKVELLLSSLVPLVVVGTILLIMGAVLMSKGMENEVLDGLLSDAIMYRDIAEEQEVRDNSLEDRLKADTGIDFTWFDGDTRVSTSVIKTDGSRPIGTKAADTVINAVINGGQTFVSEKTDVAGKDYFVAYAPVMKDGKVVSMAFAGKPRASVEEHIAKSTIAMVIVGLVLVIVAAVIILRLAGSISEAVEENLKVIDALAHGKFIKSDYRIERNDELGTMHKDIEALIDTLSEIVGDIKETAGALDASSAELSSTADQISATADDVSNAVQDIAKGATEQADSIESVTRNVSDIDSAVSTVTDNTQVLADTAESMSNDSKQSESQLGRLQKSFSDMENSINNIADAIKATESAVEVVNEKVDLITNIASQTNLLALNASIEAARAGDAGRGFAVVATEIGSLATDSNSTADEIRTEMNNLLKASQQATRIADEVLGISKEVTEVLDDTSGSVQGLISGIDTTVGGIGSISSSADVCMNAKNVVVDAISSLSAISEENAAASQETSASMEELNATVNELAASASALNELSKKLSRDMEFFQ